MDRLNDNLQRYIDDLVLRYPKLNCITKQIVDAYMMMEACYAKGGKLLIAGNGGSAADAEHMAGELMKGFKRKRPIDNEFAEKLKAVDLERGNVLTTHLEKPLSAIPLAAHEAMTTAYINDAESSCVFAQKLYGYGKAGDVFLGISTSGNSENIIKAAVVAKTIGIKTIGFTGKGGGILSEYVDITVKVPEAETYMAQELHLPIYHCWCLMLEERFFGENVHECSGCW